MNVWITSPWSFMWELSRVIFNPQTVRNIIIYWTQRQLTKVLIDWWIEYSFAKDLAQKEIIWSKDLSISLNDPYYPKIGWKYFDNIWNIPIFFTNNPRNLSNCELIFIWQNMAGISAEYERHHWEISTVKSISWYINPNSIIISGTKWISKSYIGLDQQWTKSREWWLTATEELNLIFKWRPVLVLAWPTSSRSLAESVSDSNNNKFFVSIAWKKSEIEKLKESLNPKMIACEETEDVKAISFLWIFKNIFAFLNWILEGYGLNEEQISLYQNWVKKLMKLIFEEMNLDTESIESPAWFPDFLLTCKKWRNWEGGKLVWEFLKKADHEKLSSIERYEWIREVLNKYWKTVEWFEAITWAHKRLKEENVSKQYLLLFRCLENLINWTVKFEKVHRFIIKNIWF